MDTFERRYRLFCRHIVAWFALALAASMAFGVAVVALVGLPWQAPARLFIVAWPVAVLWRWQREQALR